MLFDFRAFTFEPATQPEITWTRTQGPPDEQDARPTFGVIHAPRRGMQWSARISPHPRSRLYQQEPVPAGGPSSAPLSVPHLMP